MSFRGRMPRCGWCGNGVPDEARAEPNKADLATRLIEDADYHPHCLEAARERAQRKLAERKPRRTSWWRIQPENPQ